MFTEIEQFQHADNSLAVMNQAEFDVAVNGFLLEKHQQLHAGTVYFSDATQIDLHFLGGFQVIEQPLFLLPHGIDSHLILDGQMHNTLFKLFDFYSQGRILFSVPG